MKLYSIVIVTLLSSPICAVSQEQAAAPSPSPIASSFSISAVVAREAREEKPRKVSCMVAAAGAGRTETTVEVDGKTVDLCAKESNFSKAIGAAGSAYGVGTYLQQLDEKKVQDTFDSVIANEHIAGNSARKVTPLLKNVWFRRLGVVSAFSFVFFDVPNLANGIHASMVTMDLPDKSKSAARLDNSSKNSISVKKQPVGAKALESRGSIDSAQ